jgi:hemolysin III
VPWWRAPAPLPSARINSSHDVTQTFGEELANSISHGAGLIAALVAMPFLIANALRTGDGLFIIGASVFAASVVLLYFASAVYHAWPHGKAKHVFRIIEHGAIFLLIAGTYTPFTLGVLRGVWGWTLSILVWGLAAAGVLLKTVRGVRHPRISLALYVGMGWLLVVAIKPLWLRLPFPGLMWLVAGGLAYTVGVAFFTAKRMRYAHFVWHLFVLTGTACHFIAVRYYAG